MIIGIAGYKGSGKDSLGEILTTTFGWRKMSFAQPIKNLVHNTFGIDKAILSGTDGEREFRELPLPDWFNLSSRDMLQKVGMAFRENLHKDIWVKILENQYNSCKEHVVITDVRFPNEVEMINKHGFVCCVKRPDFNGDAHESEHALDNHVFSYAFNNDGTKEALQAKFYNFLKDRIV
jgi:hypothetical protein